MHVRETENTSWKIQLDPTAGRWVQAFFRGDWIRAYYQAPAPKGFWIQIDADGPFRLVSVILEEPITGK